MELTLKRALKLRKELEAAVSRVELPTAVNVSLLVEANVDNVDIARQVGRDRLLERVHQARDLSDILRTLRLDIATANVTGGVESLLAEIAMIDRDLAILRKLAGAGLQAPEAELKVELMAMRGKYLHGTQSDYREPAKSVNVDVVSIEVKEKTLEVIGDLRRLREELEDKRAYINGTMKIMLADDSVQLLRKLTLL